MTQAHGEVRWAWATCVVPPTLSGSRRYLGMPHGVYREVCVNRYVYEHTFLYLKVEPKYLIAEVCEFPTLCTHLDEEKSVLAAVN